jgi:hypothetical protein
VPENLEAMLVDVALHENGSTTAASRHSYNKPEQLNQTICWEVCHFDAAEKRKLEEKAISAATIKPNG